MTANALRRRSSGPRAAALMLAVPLAAAGVAAFAPEGHALAAEGDGALPGLDARRVVVPAGELGGHAVEVSEVASRLDPAEALARIERHWRSRDGAVVLRADSGAWKVLSRRTERGYETLQLRAAARGGAEGLLTRWRERDRGAAGAVAGVVDSDAASGAWLSSLLPGDAKAVRQLSSRDATAGGARAADTLIGSLPHSIDEAERRIELHLRCTGATTARASSRRRAPSCWSRCMRSRRAPVSCCTTCARRDEGGVMRTPRQRGQSMVEYLVVLMLFVLALTAGPHSPLERLFEAFGDRYQSFTHAMSMP